MAFIAAGVIEIRTTGAADNGAYYEGGGTDYSQSDTPIANFSDGDCNNSTTLTSVSAPFTNQMVGNGVHIAGAGFTTGFYVIKTFNSTSSVVLDRNPTAGGHPTTGVCNVGGACTTLIAPLSTTIVAGNTIHIKAGAYSWAALTVTAGSATAAVSILGYNAARNDNPTGANRPAITMGGAFTVGTTTRIKNINFAGNFNGSLVVLGTNCWADNCKAVLSGSPTVQAFSCAADDCLTRCEAACASGNGIVGQCTLVHACYARDSSIGISAQRSNTVITNSVIDTCSTYGLHIDTNNPIGVRLVDSTIYNCGSGIFANESSGGVYNSIIKGCTIGVEGNASARATAFNWYADLDNSTNIQNYIAQEFGSTSNPHLIDPANGNFTLFVSSPAVATGGSVGVDTGNVGFYNSNMGVYKAALNNGQMIAVS